MRGWILQQVVKLAAVAASEDDVVLLVNSDIEFLRPFAVDTFVRNGVVRFYSKPDEIDERLPRHMFWHRVARALLGLPPAEPPFTDYISSMLAWDPAIVRRMLARVTATTGRPWTTAIAGQLHFSEWTLYGVFVDDVIGAPANSFVSDDPLCLAYWDETPLNRDGAVDFLRGVRPTDVAAMMSAKSRTPLAVRRAAFAGHRAARTACHRSQAPAEDLMPHGLDDRSRCLLTLSSTALRSAGPSSPRGRYLPLSSALSSSVRRSLTEQVQLCGLASNRARRCPALSAMYRDGC